MTVRKGASADTDIRDQYAVCRLFVDAFAEIQTYGGGKRAQLWLGKELIVAYDAWKGEEHARAALAEVLMRRMGVQAAEPRPRLTKALAIHVGVCTGCGTEPDGDGAECAATAAGAIENAQAEAEWKLMPDGRLLCENCWTAEDPELAE